MGGEEVGDLDPGGPIHILKSAEVSDMMTAPQRFLFPRPCCLNRHKLWKQSWQGNAHHKLPKQGEQGLRFVPQVSNTHQVNESVSKLSFRVDLVTLLHYLLSHLQDSTTFLILLFFFSIAALLTTVAVKFLLDKSKRDQQLLTSKESNKPQHPTQTDQRQR